MYFMYVYVGYFYTAEKNMETSDMKCWLTGNGCLVHSCISGFKNKLVPLSRNNNIKLSFKTNKIWQSHSKNAVQNLNVD